MTSVTVYYMQSFWRAGRTLAKGALRKFERESEAVAACARAADREAGAIVYALQGDPAFAAWEPPRLIVSRGDVPAMKF